MNKNKNKIEAVFHKTKVFTIGIKVAEIVLATLLISASASAAFASEITPENLERLINRERIYRGIEPFQNETNLTNAAKDKANDMILKNYFGHYAYGLAPWDFILRNGYNYLYAGENLAMDFDTSEGTVAAWMKSASHRKNILNPDYDETGFGIVKGTFTDEAGTRETTIVSNMFGKRKPVVLQLLDRVINTFAEIF